MEMAERIKKQRKAAKLRQNELADILGVSTKTLQRWEYGERSPRAAELTRLAEVLNTTVSYLMGADEEGKDKNRDKAESQYNARDIRGPFVMVPVLAPQSTICCGPGADVTEVLPEVEWEEPIPEIWLTGPKGDRPYYITHVDGDSMEPVIEDGERVLVNPNQAPVHGDIAVACWNGRSMVKGVGFERNGDIRLVPVNKQYAEILIHKEDAPYELEFKGVVIRFLGVDRVSRGWL